MARKTNLDAVLIFATSFLGGVAAGFLLAPQKGSQNRKWILQQATVFNDWLDNQKRKANQKARNSLLQARKGMRRNMRHHVPNLYDATEQIDFS